MICEYELCEKEMKRTAVQMNGCLFCSVSCGRKYWGSQVDEYPEDHKPERVKIETS